MCLLAGRVRDFEVIDAFPFGIQFSWEKDGETTTTVLFERNGQIPSAKMLTFFRRVFFEKDAFGLVLHHPAICVKSCQVGNVCAACVLACNVGSLPCLPLVGCVTVSSVC